MSDSETAWFFVVRHHAIGKTFAIEYGDQKATRAQLQDWTKGRGSLIERYELPAMVDGKRYEPTLRELTDAYLRGIRIKPIPKSVSTTTSSNGAMP